MQGALVATAVGHESMNGEVVHFEVPTKYAKRAKAPFSQVFGWKTNDVDVPGWGTYTSLTATEMDEKMMRLKNQGETNGGMMKLRRRGIQGLLRGKGAPFSSLCAKTEIKEACAGSECGAVVQLGLGYQCGFCPR